MKFLKPDPPFDASVPASTAWPTEAEIRAADLESQDIARQQAESEPRPADTQAQRDTRWKTGARPDQLP